MSNAARVKRLCGARAVPGKPGTLGMKTDDIKAKIKAHVDKLNKENPIRKEFTRGKKDRASLCMFLSLRESSLYSMSLSYFSILFLSIRVLIF